MLASVLLALSKSVRASVREALAASRLWRAESSAETCASDMGGGPFEGTQKPARHRGRRGRGTRDLRNPPRAGTEAPTRGGPHPRRPFYLCTHPALRPIDTHAH